MNILKNFSSDSVKLISFVLLLQKVIYSLFTVNYLQLEQHNFVEEIKFNTR